MDLDRFHSYLAIPVDDHETRRSMAINDGELYELHTFIIQQSRSDLWPLYHGVQTAMKADRIFKDSRPLSSGMSISEIRQHLHRTEKRTYNRNYEKINETIYYRFWPVLWLVERVRTAPSELIHEIEWSFNFPVDAEEKWEKYRPGFEEESLLLCQRFPENEGIKQMAFLPPDRVRYRIIFRAGDKLKEFEFPTALRYEPLLRDIQRKYTLERVRYQPTGRKSQTLHHHSSVELAEGLTGLWIAAREYQAGQVERIPGYIKTRISWHMGDRFKEVSTKALSNDRDPETRRVLFSKLEQSGGSLDAPLDRGPNLDSAHGAITLGDRIPAELGPQDQIEQEITFQQIQKHLDESDRKILYGVAVLGLTQEELASELGISQGAVSQRFEKLINEKIPNILKS